jgi:hypothetical protein
MKDLIFSHDAQVEIQGDEVLQFVDLNNDYAIYQVIGFYEPVVYIHDYRPSGIREIKRLLETGEIDRFAHKFNVLSHVDVTKNEHGNLIIDLYPPKGAERRFMLWIAIGIRGNIPFYRYHVRHIEPLEDGKYAFIGIYKRPYKHGVHQPAPFVFSS